MSFYIRLRCGVSVYGYTYSSGRSPVFGKFGQNGLKTGVRRGHYYYSTRCRQLTREETRLATTNKTDYAEIIMYASVVQCARNKYCYCNNMLQCVYNKHVVVRASVRPWAVCFVLFFCFRKRIDPRKRGGGSTHPSHANELSQLLNWKRAMYIPNDKAGYADPRVVPLRHVYTQRESRILRILTFLCRKLSTLHRYIDLERSIVQFTKINHHGRK